jgi:Leucine-rich repeat (LRR) protein
LDELTHFYIHYTAINGTIPTNIGGMAKLTYLYAYNTQLGGAIPSQIANLPLINQINFASNTFTSLPDISALNDTLRILNLNNNNIGGGLAWLPSMTNLNQIHMGYNPL